MKRSMHEEFKIIATPRFEKDVEYYFRKKRYRKIIDDVENITKELKKGNFIGTPIPDVTFGDDNVWKVRSVNSSTNSGKSNGFRLLYYLIKEDKEVYLLTIYSKKDNDRIPSSEDIKDLVKNNIEYI